MAAVGLAGALLLALAVSAASAADENTASLKIAQVSISTLHGSASAGARALDVTPVPTLTAAPPTPDPQPGSTPAPSVTPAPSQSSETDPFDADDGADDPGFFDITGRVKAAINGWMADLVSSALNPTLRLLGRTLLATPDLTGDARIQEMWTGSQVAANSVFVLFIVAGGVLLMAHESLNTRYTLKDIAPRIFVAFVAANVSLELMAKAIEIANALTLAIVGDGLDPADAGERLTQLLVQAITKSGPFVTVLGLVTAVLAVIVILSYIVRVSVTILLIVSAPLFLICHASPLSAAVSRFWCKAFFGCFAIQLGQGLTLLTAMRVFFSPSGFDLLGFPHGSAGLINVLVATCLLWILAKIPSWVFRAVFGGGGSSVMGVVRTLVIYRGLRAVGILPGGGSRGSSR